MMLNFVPVYVHIIFRKKVKEQTKFVQLIFPSQNDGNRKMIKCRFFWVQFKELNTFQINQFDVQKVLSH